MQGTNLLKQAVACQPHGVATIQGERQRSWAEIGQRVPRIAAAMQALGLGNGQFVAALGFNSDRYLELFYAVPWAGGVFAPLNIRWAVAENAYALEHCDAQILLVGDGFVEQAEELRAGRPQLKALIYIGEGETPSGMLHYEELLESHAPMPDENRKGEDLYCIFYTSGTTARAKGVAMSHQALCTGAVTYLAMLPDVEDLRFLYVAGFFHFAAANAALYITLSGGTHVLLPKFEPVPVMQAITRHGITNAVLVPTMVIMLLNHPDFAKYDLSSLKTCIYGGSPMPEALIQEAMQKLPGWRFYQIYGMTETGGFATMLRWRDHITSGPKASRLRSAGQPAPGVEVKIVLPDGSDAPVNTLGEIVMRSEANMSYYLTDREATAFALRDGWMFSGDAGTIDEDGFLYVADRVKDMIVTGGENVYSIEVERVLFTHPKVREAAVIGVPSEQWGESVHAVVVPHEGVTVTAEELIAYCRTQIGGYKVPRSIEFRNEPLPVTPVGKVRKNVLRDPHWEGRAKKI